MLKTFYLAKGEGSLLGGGVNDGVFPSRLGWLGEGEYPIVWAGILWLGGAGLVRGAFLFWGRGKRWGIPLRGLAGLGEAENPNVWVGLFWLGGVGLMRGAFLFWTRGKRWDISLEVWLAWRREMSHRLGGDFFSWAVLG